MDTVLIPRAINRNEWLRYYEWSIKEWGTIQAPTFVGAGTGSNSTTSVAPEYPANQLNDLFVLQVTVIAQVSAPTTPAGWTLQYADSQGTVIQRIYTRDDRASGSDSGTVTVTIGAGNFVNMGRIYAFRGVSRTPTITLEGADSRGTTNGVIDGPTVEPNGYGRLAVAFLSVDSDSGMGSFTGEKGADWEEAVAEHTSGLGGGIQLQTAKLRAAPLSGGTATIGGGGNTGICRAFALLGE